MVTLALLCVCVVSFRCLCLCFFFVGVSSKKLTNSSLSSMKWNCLFHSLSVTKDLGFYGRLN